MLDRFRQIEPRVLIAVDGVHYGGKALDRGAVVQELRTGLPKPIVHGQGGIILNMHACGLHYDIGASYLANNFGERFHWYSSTGWVMWNVQLSGLATGATKLLLGQPLARVVSREAMANPNCLDWYVELARWRNTPSVSSTTIEREDSA